MKKLLTISILAIALVLMAVTGVNATTNDNLAETLYNIGAKYGMTKADKVKIERYLADYPVTESEANAIVAKANEAAKVMDNAGVTDFNKLSKEQKAEIKTIANQAASIVDVTLTYKSGSVEIYKNGKLIETVTNNNGKLAYTGNNNMVLVVSSIAVIALASVAVARNNLVRNAIKATIIELIVALFITAILIGLGYFLFGAKIEEYMSLISKVSIGVSNGTDEVETIIGENNKLKNYPEYGAKYATIKIPKIDVDLPVYYGDSLDILKKGVGHSSGSYFPGEGGSIIYMGHNSKKMFRRFSELQKGNEIEVTTTYGNFKYKIYDMQLINETDVDKLPIQKNKEILMVYTCYPFNNIGYATQRYVVYAELES